MPPYSQGPGDAQSPGRRGHTKRHDIVPARQDGGHCGTPRPHSQRFGSSSRNERRP